MKRPVAFALTVVTFAAIAFAFLRPTPSPLGHPRPILEQGTRLELSGDTEYFEYAEVVRVDYTEGRIILKLPPVEPYVLLIGSHVGESGMTGVDKGYIEKLVDGEWVYQRETYLSGMWTQEGGPPSHFSLTWNPEVVRTKYGQSYPVSFSKELFEPGDYRINLNFRQIEGTDKEVGDVITVSFNVTVPDKPTGKRFDVYPVTWGSLAIRSNDGSPAPYLVGDSVKIVDKSSRKVVTGKTDDLWEQPSPYDSTYTDYSISAEAQTYRVFRFTTQWMYHLPYGEYEISLEFAENKDGSGKRYPFTYTTTLGH